MYEEALAIELAIAGISFERQKLLPIFVARISSGEHRVDLVVERRVIVKLKAMTDLESIHHAIVRSSLKAANLSDALLLNFASTVERVGCEYHPRARKRRHTSLIFPGFLASCFSS